MQSYYSLAAVCDAFAGIKTIIFTDMNNVANHGPAFLPTAMGTPPSFTDMNKVFSISFERYTGSLSRDSVNGDGVGDYFVSTLQAFVPKSRQEVDELLNRCRNRYMCIVAIDRYGNQHLLFGARLSSKLSTGDRPGTRHGYTISITAISHYLYRSMAGTGDIETAPPIGGGGGGGGSDDTGSDACCISVNPIPIAYVPAPSGNASNLNQLVTTVDGSVYFIDADGRGIVINRPPVITWSIQLPSGSATEFITIPMDLPLPNPDDYPVPIYHTQNEMNRRIWVKVGSRWLEYGHTEGWYMDYSPRRIYFNTSIDGAIIRIYIYQNIPPIEL